jgi:hypothetical protein
MRSEPGQTITGDDILNATAPIALEMPEHWTGEWVCERMIQAFETLRKIAPRGGPKEFGTIWAEYALDYKEVRLRRRAEDGEVAKMEEALAWPARYLNGEALGRRLMRDAVGFWAYHQAMDHDIEPLIRERHQAAWVRAQKIAADANRIVAEKRAEAADRAGKWFMEQLRKREVNWSPSERPEKMAALEHQKELRLDRELAKMVDVKPKASDGANGLCISTRALRDFRRVGYEIIAAGLRRDQVTVR